MEPKDILNNIEKYYILNQKRNELLHSNSLLAILKLNQQQITNTINNSKKKEQEINDSIEITINIIIKELEKVYTKKDDSYSAFDQAYSIKYHDALARYEKYKKRLFKNEHICEALKNQVSETLKIYSEHSEKYGYMEGDFSHICSNLRKLINDDTNLDSNLENYLEKWLETDEEKDNIMELFDKVLNLIEVKKALVIDIDNKIELDNSNRKEIEKLENDIKLLEEELANSEEIDIKTSLIELSNILNKVNEKDKYIEEIKVFLSKCGGFTSDIYKKTETVTKVASDIKKGNVEEVFDTCVDEFGNTLGIDPRIINNGKVLAKNMFNNIKNMKNNKNNNEEE